MTILPIVIGREDEMETTFFSIGVPFSGKFRKLLNLIFKYV